MSEEITITKAMSNLQQLINATSDKRAKIKLAQVAEFINSLQAPSSLEGMQRVLEQGDLDKVFKNQLLICLVNQLGGTAVIPVVDVDNCGKYAMTLEANPDNRDFTLRVSEKH